MKMCSDLNVKKEKEKPSVRICSCLSAKAILIVCIPQLFCLPSENRTTLPPSKVFM